VASQHAVGAVDEQRGEAQPERGLHLALEGGEHDQQAEDRAAGGVEVDGGAGQA
jgi:hypothetical protein